MGEKYLAQQVLILLRATVGKTSREGLAALEWAGDHRDWLWPGRCWSGEPSATIQAFDWDSLPHMAAEIDTAEPDEPLLENVATAAAMLRLGDFDRALISVVAAFQRLPHLSSLRARLANVGADLVILAARLAGASSSQAYAQVGRSQAVSLGLVRIERDSGCPREFELDWRFGRLLDEPSLDEERLVEALAGNRQKPSLRRSDFAEHKAEFDLLVRLLRGALASQARGVNLLIYGPPGTGKTEFARTLANAAGARLFAVGEADVDGDEPTRSERLYSLDRAQRLLARSDDSILLFDEVEDLFTEASTAADGRRRSGSKIFVNRLLEQIAVPVIWTSNSLDAIDPAHLRRLSYVLKMSHPSPKARARIARRIAQAEGAEMASDGLADLIASEPESASIARVALRSAALAGGSSKDANAAGRSLLSAVRGGRSLLPARDTAAVDLALYDTDIELKSLVEQLTKADSPADFSLLLSGPPGTGKTALAGYLAQQLDRPLAVRRASDLLSKWVGGTEANIAAAFAEARETGAMLLFDEADSLLLDRGDAQSSWEITQVNELLTWMDSHPLPFIAATNFVRRLDPAAARRFLFKIELRPLSPAGLARAFEHFFDSAPPVELFDLQGLTPSDFALVKRQLRYRGSRNRQEILNLLRLEAEAKPNSAARLGF